MAMCALTQIHKGQSGNFNILLSSVFAFQVKIRINKVGDVTVGVLPTTVSGVGATGNSSFFACVAVTEVMDNRLLFFYRVTAQMGQTTTKTIKSTFEAAKTPAKSVKYVSRGASMLENMAGLIARLF